MKNTLSVRLYFEVSAYKITTKTLFINRVSNKLFATVSKNPKYFGCEAEKYLAPHKPIS